MSNNSPYHEGELAVQKRLNATDIARKTGGAISDSIPVGALNFIEQQTMVVIGSIDPQGQVWASVLFGKPGFLRAIDKRSLELNLAKAGTSTEDPLWKNLKTNINIGLIVIELGSRRRLRINGQLRKVSDKCCLIEVKQAYPNCPKYIQRRHLIKSELLLNQQIEPVKIGTELNSDQKALIENADTFFVASAHSDHGVDASHRGGQPGFVTVLNETLLRIPDYIGNNMFNTLGNFHSYPYAGLVFIDFKHKRLLQLTGNPKILWHLDDKSDETGGTQRYWELDILALQERSIPFNIDWEFLEYSRFNPQPTKLTNPITMSRNTK